MTELKKIKIAVVCGGPSSERGVSLKSGEQVAKNLPWNKYEVKKIEIAEDGRWLLGKKSLTIFDKRRGAKESDLKKFDVVFIALHGKFGEDGRIQAVFEILGVPYTGSGVLASALGMDKAKTSKMVASAGVVTPKFLLLNRPPKNYLFLAKRVKKEIGYPCVVKPNESGSSFGTTIVSEKKGLGLAIKKAFREDKKILIQKFVAGRELTCGVIGNSGEGKILALPPVEIIPPKGKFFDYNAKYFSKETREICPAPVKKTVAKKIQELSKKAHLALGCDGLTRSDFILAPGGKLYFLEINTIPGLTEASLCPKEARAAGINFGEFLDRQVRLALSKKPRM